MKRKIRMAAEFISAPFRKIGSFIKRPFVMFFEKHQKGIQKMVDILNKYSLLFHAVWSMIIDQTAWNKREYLFNISTNFWIPL
jgi:hypothetical protein